MTTRAWGARISGLAAALAMAGCAAAEDARTPATLESADAESVARLEAALARAMGRGSVAIAGDPTASSTITVPPQPLHPLEGLSPAMPTPFDIMKDGDRCFLVRRDTGEEFDLEGVACRAKTD